MPPHRRALRFAPLTLLVLALALALAPGAGCEGEPPPAPAQVASAPVASASEAAPSPSAGAAALSKDAPKCKGDAKAGGEGAQSAPVRGLGAMTARVPGTGEVVPGVRLVSHKVEVVLRDGFARTQVEEEFLNETAQVLEGRYAFPLPPDASISRLALWVGPDLVEGEVLERKRAAAIFQQIVDDTVRPRDPALLEWVAGSELSLRIFPIPARSSRKVLFAYNQVLPVEGGRGRYVYPLSLGADRSATVGEFSLSVKASASGARLDGVATPCYPASIRTEEGEVTVDYSAKAFAPSDDFVVSFSDGGAGSVRTAVYTPREGEFQPRAKGAKGAKAVIEKEKFVALRVQAGLPEGTAPPQPVRRDVAVVVDVSHSQSRETLEGEVKLAAGLLRQLGEGERFVVLACDSACSTYPESGLASPSSSSIDAAAEWLRAKAPGGSSSLSDALFDAAGRLDAGGSGQVIYIGDGAATAGELSAASIAARVKPVVDARAIDVRLLGAGRTVDEVLLAGLARAIGAGYERVETGDSLEDRIAEIAAGLRSPVIRGVTAELPSSLTEVYPRELPSLRLGEEVIFYGRAAGELSGDIVLRGDLRGSRYELRRPVAPPREAAGAAPPRENPLVPRLWAEARIRDLEASGDSKRLPAVIDLSTRFHVMARPTAFLVLENEQMFAEFGVERTTRKAAEQSDHSFLEGADASEGPGAGGDAAPAAGAPRPAARKPAPGVWREIKHVFHAVEGAEWAKSGEEALAKLRKASADAPLSRRKKIALVRGLLARGRFEEALTEATRFSEGDPDLGDAHELVAQAAAASGDAARAAREVDTQAELNPRRSAPHLRAGRAFEALGDERRACAHFRSAAELDPKSDDALYEALRCRARILEGQGAVLREARALDKMGPRVKKLVATLEAGEAPRYSPSGGYLFKAAVTCAAPPASPPKVIVVTAFGVVVSPWTPDRAPSEASSVALQSAPDGTYRTIISGAGAGAQCELSVQAHGIPKKFPAPAGDGERLIVRTGVETTGYWEVHKSLL